MNVTAQLAAYQREIIANFRKSGLTKAAYCQKHKLKLSVFEDWCLRSEPLPVESSLSTAAFVPVVVSKPKVQPKTAAYYRLLMKQDICLEIPDTVAITTLHKLLHKVGAIS